jgi:hypothetical protein
VAAPGIGRSIAGFVERRSERVLDMAFSWIETSMGFVVQRRHEWFLHKWKYVHIRELRKKTEVGQ